MNKTRSVGRIFYAVLCVVLTFVMILPLTASLFVGAASNNAFDIIIVVDDTRSMQTTDPNKLSAVAVNKFVDKFTAVDARFGIVTYDVEAINFLELGQNADAIRDFSNTKITQQGRGTDAAAGLKWAVNQLETKGDPTRIPAIAIIGDGANSYTVNGAEYRTQADSDAMLNDAISVATSKGIKVYTVAINPEGDSFRQYFESIATRTGGTTHEPKDVAQVDTEMKKIFESISGQSVNSGNPVPVTPGTPVTQNFDVPAGVFAMTLQVDHSDAVSITFKDPSTGNIINKDTQGVKYIENPAYTTVTINNPAAGNWSVTYTSSVAQTIYPNFIFFTNLTVSLSKNQNAVDQAQQVQYIATVSDKGQQINDGNNLNLLTATLVVIKLDKSGNETSDKESVPMTVSNGTFIVDYAISGHGKYKVYAEIVGEGNAVKSNELVFDVKQTQWDWWVWALIIGGALILIIVLILVYMNMMKRPGGGQVRGNVAIKIVGRHASDETMIFQQDRFDCMQIFGKKNTLSDLITAYVKRYRMENTSELAEMSLTQFINSTLSEVTDKVGICGNKKKQTIVTIPAGYEMQVDGMEISKTKTMAFSSPEKVIELRFKNQGCSYTINLIFTKA